jgi:hypothetical protein
MFAERLRGHTVVSRDCSAVDKAGAAILNPWRTP